MKRAAAFAAVYFGWGSLYLAIRVALESFPPFTLAAAGMLVSGAALYALAALKNPPPTGGQWRYAFLTGVPLVFFGNGAVVWGEQYVPSSVTAIILATEALWLVVLDWLVFRGPRPAGRTAFAIALGFAGTAILVGFGLPEGVEPRLRGFFSVFLATLGWSLGSLVSRRDPAPPAGAYQTAMPMLTGGVLLAAVAAATGEWRAFSPADVTARSAWAFAHVVVIGSVAAYSAYVWLLKNVSLAKASTYAYVNPLVAVALGWAVGGEEVNLRMAAGSVLILISTVIVLSHKEARA